MLVHGEEYAEEVSKEPEKCGTGVGKHAPVSTSPGRTFVSLLVGIERQGSFSIGVERAVRKLSEYPFFHKP